MHNLLIAYVWHLEDFKNRVTYALTYKEAFAIIDQLGWTKTESWKKGVYTTTNPSKEILSTLELYKMTPQRWREKITKLMEYDDREHQKIEGWELFKTGRTLSERARGLLMVAVAHFYRNPNAPDLSTYVSHWLWANRERFDREIIKLLVKNYPPPGRPQIQPGYSDWGSYGNSNYKIVS